MNEDPVGVLKSLVVGFVAMTARSIAAVDAELTFMQRRVLLVVGERDEGQAVGEIAARIGAHASPSRFVPRLRCPGLVSTDKGQLDKRVVGVRLTGTGRGLRARVLDGRGRDFADVWWDPLENAAELLSYAALAVPSVILAAIGGFAIARRDIAGA